MDRSKLYSYSEGKQFAGKPVTEVFEQIARSNFWIEKESSSGFGSSLKQTTEIAKKLPSVLAAFKIRRFLDLPCGDFNWMKEMDFSGIEYSGADILKDLVDQNINLYQSPNISFLHLDIMKDDLGNHDMLFCRDCLVHFSFEDLSKALINIKKNNISYLMTTTFPGEEVNKDIVTGGWRPLNLEIEPFSFPKPLFLLNEGCTEMDGVFGDKSIGVWRIKDL